MHKTCWSFNGSPPGDTDLGEASDRIAGVEPTLEVAFDHTVEEPGPGVACPEVAFDRTIEVLSLVELRTVEGELDPEVASSRTVVGEPIPEVAFDHNQELAIVVAAACHIQQPETVREAHHMPEVEVVEACRIRQLQVPGCASCSAVA